ncbi:lycopene beta-cyclase CrtY [Stakelama sp. CBK3Z-3]|uniref:Lycopene beta-cyclase CrtY n=1 Tax=Stakelama flava TaxID=2860338 RepID=A0ABS6XP09_9SPHN|nr:lycopene beta-cyclase CrtY [Stakelama flava]MBW4331937.1 lycopene beta-cyclase CrtY [Stakelama flava]
MPERHTCDVAIVGGGLSGALIALALKKKRPDINLRLIESTGRIGGNHLWSFFASDIGDADRWLVAPLISHGWTGYDVHFPNHSRTLKQGYYSIDSDRLDQVVRERLYRHEIMFHAKVLGASARTVVLGEGDRIEAKGVIDCRGAGDLSLLDCGWQKFVGLELELEDAHDLPRPVIMDATVDQHDGYRFVYCLPFAATRMFIEDTYYSDTPDIDRNVIGRRIGEYALGRGWSYQQLIRTEAGALPVTMDGDFEGYWKSGGHRVAKAGMRAGLFHPLTGYSLPDAVRAAAMVAGMTDLSGGALHDALYGLARRTWKARGFYRILARMLFRAAEPGERYRVLERFYRLDADLIARFYAGQATLFDQARVLTGKPPVPIGKAIDAIRGSRR